MSNLEKLEYLQKLVFFKKGVKHKKRILHLIETLKDKERFYEEKGFEAY